MEVVQKEYVIGRMPMISGIGQQAEIDLWDYAIDKSGNHWFWPVVHDESGSMVHTGSVRVGREKSDGYGGRTMDFPTKSGVISIQGPWHSNSDALFEATGVDLRDKHITFGVVAKSRKCSTTGTVYQDILYIDPDGGKVGLFERMDIVAKDIANSLDCCVFRYRQSRGGSSDGPVYPDSWTDEQITQYWKN